jgi:hypothetical protein
MVERTTVRLSEDLLDRARKKAAAEGRTLTSLLEEGLRLVVSENRPKRDIDIRALPPISRATGGTMPGIELTKLSALEEMDDLERFGGTKRSQ